MPSKAKKPCSYPMCPNLTTERYCDEHKKKINKQYDQQRGTAAQRGYDARWRKARKYFLSKNPLCVRCMEQGRLTIATVVDHIIPHKGDKKLFWDSNNWQALCASCHSRKTAKEDGRWG
jgi:5-methylcytosine-specific restriction enzyme A